MEVEALGRVQVYFLLYIGTALLLSLWVLPGLIAVLTPLPARRVLAHTQDALITAFATGSLLIVIPLMAERSKELLDEIRLRNPETESAIDLMVPINFNLPNMGKLLSLALGLVVRDHDRQRFATVPLMRQAGTLRIAVLGLPHYEKLVRAALPEARLVPVRSPREFFEAPQGEYDALLFSAEGGSAWTLLYPAFSVVVPRPDVVTGPMALATPRSAPGLHDYVSTWVALKRQDGVARHLYDFWILGRGAESTEPRWSACLVGSTSGRAGGAQAEAGPPGRFSTSSRSRLLSTFPVAVAGSASSTTISPGRL